MHITFQWVVANHTQLPSQLIHDKVSTEAALYWSAHSSLETWFEACARPFSFTRFIELRSFFITLPKTSVHALRYLHDNLGSPHLPIRPITRSLWAFLPSVLHHIRHCFFTYFAILMGDLFVPVVPSATCSSIIDRSHPSPVATSLCFRSCQPVVCNYPTAIR